jgi:hypothetical protein
VTLGQDDPNEPAEIVGDESNPQNQKDAEAPENKTVASAPKKNYTS